MLNKAKLFNKGLAKSSVTAAKVILVLIDFNQKMEEILLDMQGLFEELEVKGLVPLDQVPNISINTKELPMLQGWETRIVGQTPTFTKPTQSQASETTKEATEVEDKPACKPESQLEPDLTLEESESPQPLVLDNMVVVARRVLSKNPDIAQRMMELLKSQPGRPLRPEEFQAATKLVQD